MTQPDWRYVCNLGDVNPEHGAAFVFEDTTGAYPPEMEIWKPEEEFYNYDTGESRTHYRRYRFALDHCTYVDGILSDNLFHPETESWFARELPHIARSAGLADCIRLLEWFCSPDTKKRAMAFQTVVDYYGAHEFDHYPDTFTEEEARARWAVVEHMEHCARVGLHPDTPAPIVHDAMIDAGLLRE